MDWLVKGLLIFWKNLHEQNANYKGISCISGISINTLKKFLAGGKVEKRSLEKLMVLGSDFSNEATSLLQKRIKMSLTITHICQREDSRKYCRAYRTVFVPEKKTHEGYCPFGCKQLVTEDGKIAAIEDCPFPTSMHELMESKNKFDFKLRGEIVYIPAKGETF